MGRKLIELDVDKIRKLYNKGYNIREIGDIMDVSRNTIHHRMKLHNIPRRKLAYILPEERSMLNDRYNTIKRWLQAYTKKKHKGDSR